MVARRTARALARGRALDVLSAHYRVTRQEAAGLRRPRVHLPYLHAVPRSEEADFRALLDRLSADHVFIGYSEALERIRSGRVDQAYVSFSFDDGFASNERLAHILEEYGTVGMFFVPTGFVGTETVPEAREFFGFSRGCDEPALTWGQLEDMRSRGHEIGNHTVSHRILATLSPQQRHDEVAGAADELRRRIGESRHFAWPYGRFAHFTDDAARFVFETGHESCASAERGAHLAAPDPEIEALCVRRDHLMTEWPLRHSTFFLARSAARTTPKAGRWPTGWSVVS